VVACRQQHRVARLRHTAIYPDTLPVPHDRALRRPTWLTICCRPWNPTNSGAEAPNTHEFKSGAWNLHSMSPDTGKPEVPCYTLYSCCVLDQLSCAR